MICDVHIGAMEKNCRAGLGAILVRCRVESFILSQLRHPNPRRVRLAMVVVCVACLIRAHWASCSAEVAKAHAGLSCGRLEKESTAAVPWWLLNGSWQWLCRVGPRAWRGLLPDFCQGSPIAGLQQAPDATAVWRQSEHDRPKRTHCSAGCVASTRAI